MRTLLIAIVAVVGLGVTARPAEARRGGAVVINTGDDIVHLRDLAPDIATALGYRSVGYHYDRFGLFWFDLWRWDGEYVVYDRIGGRDDGAPAATAGAIHFAAISEAELETLGGAPTPWRYHLPDGLLIVLALGELVIMTRMRRRLKVTLVIGGGFVIVAIAFFVMGLTWEFMIPGFLALHHLAGSYFSVRNERDVDTGDVAATRAAPVAPPHADEPAPQAADAHPDAAPSRPSQPLAIERPPTAPIAAPIVHDDNAAGPKLLR